ncbi:MAG TPA: tetratricopeptide repeat protein [Terriglobales bacterium]|nr:tetratricopeptide repeat protein [Terriglobales bacterium]
MGAAPESTWKIFLDEGKRLGQQGDYQGAERSFLAALREAESFGPKDLRVGEILNVLGLTYIAQQRSKDAQSVLTRALAIREASLGVSHKDTNATRNNLANVFAMQGQVAQAEELYQRAIQEIEHSAGQYAPELDYLLTSLSRLYLLHGGAVDAEPLARRALAINEKAQGLDGLRVQENLHQLASILQTQKKYGDAVAVAFRVAINRKVLGPRHPQVGISLQILGQIHISQRSFKDAETELKDALTIFEQSLGPRHSLVGETLRYYAVALRGAGHDAEAEKIQHRMRELGF